MAVRFFGGEEVRSRLTQLEPDYLFVSCEDRAARLSVEVQWSRSSLDEEQLTHLVELLFALLTTELKLLEEIGALPEAGPVERGPMQYVRASIPFVGRGVRGRFLLGDEGCTLEAERAPARPDTRVLKHVSCDQIPAGTLYPQGAAALPATGHGAFLSVRETQVRVHWAGIPEASEVQAAWTVLLSLTAPSTRRGAFR